MLNKRQLLRS